MKAIGKNIIIEKLQQDSKSESSGFDYSDKDISDSRYQKGKVITTGSHVDLIKDGDTIFYDKVRGYDTFIAGEKVTVVEEQHVVVVL